MLLKHVCHQNYFNLNQGKAKKIEVGPGISNMYTKNIFKLPYCAKICISSKELQFEKKTEVGPDSKRVDETVLW